MAAPSEHFSLRKEGDVLVMTVEETHLRDFDVCTTMSQQIAETIGTMESPLVAVDMSGLVFIASVGYLPFLKLARCVREAGGRLVLCGVSDKVKEVFRVSRLLISPASPGALFHTAADLAEGTAFLLGPDPE